MTVVGKGDAEEAREPDANGPLCTFVFKTVSDPFVGHITMFRVFSGQVGPIRACSTRRRPGGTDRPAVHRSTADHETVRGRHG